MRRRSGVAGQGALYNFRYSNLSVVAENKARWRNGRPAYNEKATYVWKSFAGISFQLHLAANEAVCTLSAHYRRRVKMQRGRHNVIVTYSSAV